MPSAPTETAVVVRVPQAEPVVGALRRALDPAAGWGVPAHVTVIYPFVPPDRIDAAVLHRLAAAVRSVGRRDAAFPRTSWFEDRVLWLAPEPDTVFRELTDAVQAAFPEHPPYEGVFDDVVPHLTVGEVTTDGSSPGDLRTAEDRLAGGLPVTTRVRTVDLLAGSPGPDTWYPVVRLPLGWP